jgi:putative spermidine/putrescine transport system ATP-binding protein
LLREGGIVAESFIRFDKVTKDYGTVRVVEDLDLDIARGEFVSLLGPSGSGKTTLLMMLAGFETVTKGAIILDGQRLNGVPTYKRDMGVVFQNYALFPHMNIARNVAFPLEMRGTAKSDIAARVKRALDMVQLGHLSDRMPGQLSGGQQQRVALARSLVFEPRVVLMDEPLGALDKQLREQMQLDIRELHHRLGLTIIFVTHDQDEALTMSDRIAVFDKGQIQQCATPRQVYDHPANRFVAEFIGETNLLPGKVTGVDGSKIALTMPDGSVLRADGATGLAVGDAALLSLRPERIDLHGPNDAPAGLNSLRGEVADTIYQGDHLRIVVTTPAGRIIARVPRKAAEWPNGASVALGFRPADGWIIAP